MAAKNKYESENGVVVLTYEDHIAWITLNRPNALNAISNEVRQALPAALAACEDDEAVKVIVLRGAGDRAFCVGADIKEFETQVSPIKMRQKMVLASYVEAIDKVTTGIVLATLRQTFFCRGDGGFGGPEKRQPGYDKRASRTGDAVACIERDLRACQPQFDLLWLSRWRHEMKPSQESTRH